MSFQSRDRIGRHTNVILKRLVHALEDVDESFWFEHVRMAINSAATLERRQNTSKSAYNLVRTVFIAAGE